MPFLGVTDSIAVAGPIWEQIPAQMRHGGIGEIPRIPATWLVQFVLPLALVRSGSLQLCILEAGPGLQWKHTIYGWTQVILAGDTGTGVWFFTGREIDAIKNGESAWMCVKVHISLHSCIHMYSMAEAAPTCELGAFLGLSWKRTASRRNCQKRCRILRVHAILGLVLVCGGFSKRDTAKWLGWNTVSIQRSCMPPCRLLDPAKRVSG